MYSAAPAGLPMEKQPVLFPTLEELICRQVSIDQTTMERK